MAANTLAGRPFDVCVMGAGPAGLAVAWKLVDLCRDVLILDRPTARSRWGGETFTGAIRGLLSDLAGLLTLDLPRVPVEIVLLRLPRED